MAKLKLHPSHRRRWMQAEEGSFQDHDGDPSHVYAILQRGTVATPAEAETLVRSARYWSDAQGWDYWTPAFGRALTKIIAYLATLEIDQ